MSTQQQTLAVRLSDSIKQYDGHGDCAEWLEKFELVADTQGIADRSKFLPLFLSGGAFSVYLSVAQEDRGDYGKLRKALLQAFGADEFKAYEELTARTRGIDEPVDVYASAVTRLATLVCGAPNEGLAKCAFVAGLPEAVRQQLRAACSLSHLTLSEVKEKARVLVSSLAASPISAAAVGADSSAGGSRQGRDTRDFRKPPPHASRAGAARPLKSRRACFVCGATSHLVAACPERWTGEPKNE